MTKDEWLAKFEPLMVSYYAGAVCRRCQAWIPRVADGANEYYSYEKHLAWHNQLDNGAQE